jgi:type VI secretion system protein ImpE
VPLVNVRELRIEAPTDLRDFVWAAAQFTWTNGGEIVALLPSRYPDSDSDADPLIRLGRKTEWDKVAEGAFIGRGQKTLMTDGGEYPLLDIRSIRFDDDQTDGP